MQAVPRLCIVYPGMCITTEENNGKPQSGYPKGARLISAERDSFEIRFEMISSQYLSICIAVNVNKLMSISLGR